MDWPQAFSLFLPPPASKPVCEVEQDILDELKFHVEMRALDNVAAGMTADDARKDAERRFGDFERIHKACRRTLLGERIMLQRIQAVLTLVLLGAVVYLGVELYRGQRSNESAMARVLKSLDQASQRSSATLSPQFDALEPSTLDQAFPHDAKLTDVQRGFRNWSEATFPAMDAGWWQSLNEAEKNALEDRWLKQLSSSSEKKREEAIQCLASAACRRRSRNTGNCHRTGGEGQCRSA